MRADFTNFQRHQISTLGQQHRRPALLGIVFEGDGEVCRVGDDHVCFGNGGHHAPLRHFTLQLTNTLLDLRAALAVLVLVAHLLLGHQQFLVRFIQHERHIRRRDEYQAAGHPETAPAHHHQAMDHGLLERLVSNRDQILALIVQDHQRHCQSDQEFSEGLEQLDQRMRREHAFEPCCRVHAAELGHQRFGCEKPATEHDRPHQCSNQHGDQKRQDHDQRMHPGTEQRLAHVGLVHQGFTGYREIVTHQFGHHQGDIRAEHQ